MKNENTDTINRAIHSAMGGCYEYVRIDRGLDTFCGNCDKPWRDCDANSIKPNYTIPGQPLEDAKAWAVEKFGGIVFGRTLANYLEDFSCAAPYWEDPASRYDWIAGYATLPALDMANIIAGLINEGE